MEIKQIEIFNYALLPLYLWCFFTEQYRSNNENIIMQNFKHPQKCRAMGSQIPIAQPQKLSIKSLFLFHSFFPSTTSHLPTVRLL